MDSPSRSGVFGAAADHRVASFTESISFDARLYSHDILGSIAHAKMLQEIGILTADEAVAIETTLLEIKTKIEAGDFQTNIALEDIHMHIEALLIDKLGDVGRKLHTGRSRNDQSVPIFGYGYELPWTMSINCCSTYSNPSSTAATTIMM